MYKFPEDMKKAYESSPLSFVYYQNIDHKAVPILASDGFVRNTGLNREDALAWLKVGMFERMHPDDVGVVSQISDDFLHQRGPYDIVFRCRMDSVEKDPEAVPEYVQMHGIGKWQTMPDGMELGREENMRICRIDHVDEGTHDGVFLTGEDQIKGSDTDPSDGWTAPKGSFAIAGVMKPYQLQDDELVPDQEIYSYYKYQNGADTLIYTFTPAEGSDDGSKPFSIRKPVGIKRIDTPDQEAETEAAVYEFYNVFPADTLKTGTSYKVTVQAYDRKDVAIEGAACDFTLTR